VDADVHAVGLLGTRYTMDDPTFKSYFVRRAVDVIVPHGDDRAFINDAIYQELCQGVVSKETKLALLDIIDSLEVRGAQAIVLGCTELDLIVEPADTILPVLDSAALHATAAARLALAGD
jgi:aspartate racemase